MMEQSGPPTIGIKREVNTMTANLKHWEQTMQAIAALEITGDAAKLSGECAGIIDDHTAARCQSAAGQSVATASAIRVPTWRSTVPSILRGLKSRSVGTRKEAASELVRMGRAADRISG
jgi:hypothetical protein